MNVTALEPNGDEDVISVGPADESFRSLFNSVVPDLHNYVARQCPPSDVDDITAEIMGEVFVHWENAPDTRERQRMWVFGFARNKLKEVARRQRYGDALIARTSTNYAVDEEFESLTVGNDRVRRLLNRLPDKERETLYLTVFAGFTCAETAAILGVSTSAVTTRVSRARKHLKRIISAEERYDA